MTFGIPVRSHAAEIYGIHGGKDGPDDFYSRPEADARNLDKVEAVAADEAGAALARMVKGTIRVSIGRGGRPAGHGALGGQGPAGPPAEVFTFATRLTRVTRVLAGPHPGAALE
jgi:hypothetical protein